MLITVLSQYATEHYQPRPSSICISITGTIIPQAVIPDGYIEILRLRFDDVHDHQRDPGAQPFTLDMAAQIAKFVSRHQSVEEIVIHCHQGVSRSAGVAMALADVFAGGHAEKAFEYRLPEHHRKVRVLTRGACQRVAIQKQAVDVRSGLGNPLL